MAKRGLRSIGINKIIPAQIDFTQVVSGSAAGPGSFIALSSDSTPVLVDVASYYEELGDIQGVTAGNGLTGGGTTGTVTLNVGSGTGISVAADSISTNDSEIVHDNLSGFVSDEHIAHSTVSITAGNGLTGGGTIAATRTINIGAGTGITVASDSISFDPDGGTLSTSNLDVDHILINDGGVFKRIAPSNIDISSFNNDSGFTANTGDITGVTAGNGLTGGGSSGAVTLNIGEGVGITVAGDSISVDVSDFMTNGVDNRVLTATSADSMNAEANLTFDGSTLECNATLRVSEYISHIGDTDTRIQFTDNNIKIATANNTAIDINSSGIITKPLQPCFRATKSSVQSNISVNTRVVVTFDGEDFDRNSDFASSAFTAPVSGIYLFGGHADFDALDISATQILMSLQVDPADGGANYYVDLDQKDPNEYNTDMETFSTIGSTLFELAANDVVKLTVYQAGGSAISDIGTRSRFWGTLIN
jgi:hypothetical protein